MQIKRFKITNTTAQFEHKYSPDNVFMLQFFQETDFSQGGTWHPLKNESEKQMTSLLTQQPSQALWATSTSYTPRRRRPI